jgi:hypothetical protein
MQGEKREGKDLGRRAEGKAACVVLVGWMRARGIERDFLPPHPRAAKGERKGWSRRKKWEVGEVVVACPVPTLALPRGGWLRAWVGAREKKV